MNSLYALFSKWSLRASSARVELLLIPQAILKNGAMLKRLNGKGELDYEKRIILRFVPWSTCNVCVLPEN